MTRRSSPIVERDFTSYGDECLHGGGKTLRDGAGLAAGVTSAQGALDLLLCNVVVIDAVLGVVKCDLGVKDGRIVGIGKAGNPAVMDGVDPRLIVSSGTTVRDCEGLIATAGAIDVHVHFDSAALSEHAIASGITTMLGGSLGADHRRHRFRRPVQHRQDAAGGRSLADQLRLPGPRQLA